MSGQTSASPGDRGHVPAGGRAPGRRARSRLRPGPAPAADPPGTGTGPRTPPPAATTRLTPRSPAPSPGRIGVRGRIRCTGIHQILPGTRILPGNEAAGTGEAEEHPAITRPGQERQAPAGQHRTEPANPASRPPRPQQTLTHAATYPKEPSGYPTAVRLSACGDLGHVHGVTCEHALGGVTPLVGLWHTYPALGGLTEGSCSW